MKNILKELNLSQQQAVKHNRGPALVIAGAGTGKTTVLTYRICYLIQNGTNIDNVLAVTFTNKAANEIKSRVRKLVKHDNFKWIGTFHSICLKILRQEAELVGFGANFVIYDSADQRALIKICLKELGIEEAQYKPQAVQEHISRAKSRLIWPDEYRSKRSQVRDAIIAKVYTLYQNKLRQCNALDFDDLIAYTVKLLMDNPRTLQKYQNMYKHVLIDEYQDTNCAQHKLVKLLSKHNGNVFAVGDEDQSIYGFRGAEVGNILDFKNSFTKTKLYKLEQNYRSTQTILRCANGLIGHNSERIGKTLWTKNEVGDKIMRNHAVSEHEEVELIVQSIKELYKKRRFSLGEMVVFYRVHALSRIIEEGFRRARIPYEIVGGVGFYGRKEIKDILAYLKLVVSSSDDVSFLRVINTPVRGIGQGSVKILAEYAKNHKMSLYAAAHIVAEIPKIPTKAKTAFEAFVKMIENLRLEKEDINAGVMLKKIIDASGYVKALKEQKTADARARIENVNELKSAALEFEERNDIKTTERFLEEISLFSDIDFFQEDDDKVTLMTIHAAKGLQFGVVFLVGMEKGIFPYVGSQYNGDGELEEERRLCYVALTRAKKLLYISSAQNRLLYGARLNNEISPFLTELPHQLLEEVSLFRKLQFDPEKADHDVQPSKGKIRVNTSYAVGEKVKHLKFGKGKITKIYGQGEDMRLTIQFTKQPSPMLLMAKFANLCRE
ncbi:MAG: UvrD-helicase domain-containing protein [Candidatus Ancaeobacter aquaticus]|nr:UvrD-helicase domain-containing protein [Candidatus Ancaeobacter aquaticus]